MALMTLVLAGCGAAGEAPTSDPWTIEGAVRDLPPDIERTEGRPGENGGTVLESSSVQIEEGTAYRFSLGHCGLFSPVDLDGSFWDAVEGHDADGRPIDLRTHVEMINATSGLIAVVGDEARFRTDSGLVVRFERVFGSKEFPACG